MISGGGTSGETAARRTIAHSTAGPASQTRQTRPARLRANPSPDTRTQ